MAEQELEALRKQRLAELQAKHGVSEPNTRPARSLLGSALTRGRGRGPPAQAPGVSAPGPRTPPPPAAAFW